MCSKAATERELTEQPDRKSDKKRGGQYQRNINAGGNLNNSDRRKHEFRTKHASGRKTPPISPSTRPSDKTPIGPSQRSTKSSQTAHTGGANEAWKLQLGKWWEIAQLQLPVNRRNDKLLHTLHSTFADVVHALSTAAGIDPPRSTHSEDAAGQRIPLRPTGTQPIAYNMASQQNSTAALAQYTIQTTAPPTTGSEIDEAMPTTPAHSAPTTQRNLNMELNSMTPAHRTCTPGQSMIDCLEKFPQPSPPPTLDAMNPIPFQLPHPNLHNVGQHNRM